MEMTFDLDQITIGDMEDIEEICGLSYEAIDWKKPSAKLMKAIVFINGRHQNPDFTLEDARNLKVADVKIVEPNPTEDGEAS